MKGIKNKTLADFWVNYPFNINKTPNNREKSLTSLLLPEKL